MKMYLLLWLCLVQILLRSTLCNHYQQYDNNSELFEETVSDELEGEEPSEIADKNDIRGHKVDVKDLATALLVHNNGITEISTSRTTPEEHAQQPVKDLRAKQIETGTLIPMENTINYIHNDSDTVTVTKKQAAVHVPIPEPKHMFINYITVESLVTHVTLENVVIDTVHSALAASTYFVRTESLVVHSLTTTTYKHTESGNTVLQVAYYVSYNRRVLQNTEVSKVLQSKEASATLHHHLKSHGINEYKISHVKSWTKEHATIIGVSAVSGALLLLLVIVIVVVKKRSSTNYDTKKRYVSAKDNERLDKKKLASMYNNDLSTAFENPVYNFETNSVMDGRAMP